METPHRHLMRLERESRENTTCVLSEEQVRLTIMVVGTTPEDESDYGVEGGG
jgi:hypothetical protein